MSRLRMFLSMSLLGLALVAVIGCGGKKEESDDSGSSEANSSSSSSSASAGDNTSGGGGGSTIGSPSTQGSTLPADKQAVVAFDLDLASMMNSELGSMVPAEEAMREFGAAGPEAEALMALKRVSGFVSVPEDMGTIMGMAMMGPSPGQPLPMDFLLTVEFVDAASAKDIMDEVRNNSVKSTLGGKEVYKPEGPGAPPIYVQIVNDSKMVAGTETFLTANSSVATSELQKRWSAMPNSSVKLAVDMDGARPLLTEAANMLRQDAPPMAAPYIDLIDKGAFMSLAFDPTGDQLVHVTMDGHNAEDTQAINTVLAGLIQLAAMMSTPAINDMRSQSPQTADMMSELVKSLGTEVSGNTVSISVAKPAGFDEAMKEAMEAAKTAADQVSKMNDLKQLALAVMNFESVHKRFPFNMDPANFSEDLSWRVLILPYMEEQPLYDQFDVKQGWDSDTNMVFADQMPMIYGEDGANSTIVYVRPEEPVNSFGDIRDGSSNSIMLLETLTPVPWTQNVDISVAEAIELVNGLPEGEQVRAARYDGSVVMLPGDFSPEEIEAMMHPNDGR